MPAPGLQGFTRWRNIPRALPSTSFTVGVRGMLQVLVADQHPIVRTGLRSLGKVSKVWEVCGEVGDVTAYGPHARYDVIILDPEQLTPGSLLRELLPDIGAAHVIIYTNRADGRGLQEGLAAGARGYILKSDPVDSLEIGISTVGSGRLYFSGRMAELLPFVRSWNGEASSAQLRYTRRELEVVNFIADGLSNKQIAVRLGTSIKTIERQRSSAMQKVGAHSAAQLVRMAILRNLVPN